MAADKTSHRAQASVPWAGFESIAQALIGILSILVVVRLIGPEAYGLASLAIVIVALIEAALTGGLHEAIIKARSAHTEILDTLFWTRLGLGLLAFGLSLLVAGNITVFFQEPELPALIAVYGFTCVINALSELPAALLTRKFRARALAQCALASRTVIFLSSATFAFVGLGAWSLVLSSLLGLALQCAMLWSYIPRRPRVRYHFAAVRSLLGFGVIVSAETLLVAVVSRLFMFLFGYFHGVEALGLLNFAVRLVDELAMVLTRISAKFAYPLFAALERGGTSASEPFSKSSRFMAYVAFPMFAGIGLVAHEFVILLFGPQWATSIPMMQALAIYWVLASPRFLVGPLLRALGRPSVLLFIAGADALLSLGVLLAMAEADPVTTTWMWAARIVITAPLTAVILARVGGVSLRDQALALAPAAAATICMALALYGLKVVSGGRLGSWSLLVLEVALGAAAFVGTVLALDRRTARLVIDKVRRRRG